MCVCIAVCVFSVTKIVKDVGNREKEISVFARHGDCIASTTIHITKNVPY